MKFICSLLTVSDINISRNFHEKLLNQKVKFDFGENVTFEGDFAIHLKSHFQNLIENKEIKFGGNNFELYFEENNIEEIVELLHKNNVEFIHEIKEQHWRQKVARFYDPDKNIIEIGESMEFLCYRLFLENIDSEQI
jgi:catechol 2,3-dioxygenase-like lactoylglutathione lyase family enzyme